MRLSLSEDRLEETTTLATLVHGRRKGCGCWCAYKGKMQPLLSTRSQGRGLERVAAEPTRPCGLFAVCRCAVEVRPSVRSSPFLFLASCCSLFGTSLPKSSCLARENSHLQAERQRQSRVLSCSVQCAVQRPLSPEQNSSDQNCTRDRQRADAYFTALTAADMSSNAADMSTLYSFLVMHLHPHPRRPSHPAVRLPSWLDHLPAQTVGTGPFLHLSMQCRSSFHVPQPSEQTQ